MRDKLYCTLLAGLVWGAPIALAQSLVEFSVSAAGGSAAGVAGKHVSDKLDKVLVKVQETTAEAASRGEVAKPAKPTSGKAAPQPGRAAPQKETLAAPAAGNRKTSPTRSASQRAPRRPARGRQASASLADVAVVNVPYPAPPRQESILNARIPGETTRDEVVAVEQGTPRDEVLSRLGKPAARVVIPEEGRLREIYYYQSRGETVGTVRLTDGAVESVRLSIP